MEDELKKLIKQNIKLSRENKALIEQDHEMIKKIRRFVIASQITWGLKFIIIAVPIILAILYIPPFFRDLIDKFQNFFGIMNISEVTNIFQNMFSGLKSTNNVVSTSTPNNILPDNFLKLLK